MNNYWIDFWNKYADDSTNKDEQTQVLRTFRKKPIDNETWNFTLKTIEDPLSLKSTDNVLELCCGNGLISKYISQKVNSIVSVDTSSVLIKELNSNNIKNIKAFSSDIRKLDLNNEEFDKIIIYAGIQYLDYSETIILFKNMFKWLKPKGIIFIGDIPDQEKLWSFYNNKERTDVFFKHCENRTDVVGTWFEKSFIEKLANYTGFSECKVLEQHNRLIYSSFRYDFVVKKG